MAETNLALSAALSALPCLPACLFTLTALPLISFHQHNTRCLFPFAHLCVVWCVWGTRDALLSSRGARERETHRERERGRNKGKQHER
mmetsp:Transcript_16400/g.46675  ORF Transcript_16400/g.46675 Transcript_16400/m.46675 type:complete len:88 (+) Transcript_16400:412-675(+)